MLILENISLFILTQWRWIDQALLYKMLEKTELQ